LSAIVALMLGIKEKRLANGDRLTFLQGLGTGVSIALTYAVLMCLYFALLLKLIGPKLMQQEGETNVAGAFLGLGIGLTVFGTIFSVLISLVLKKN
jgi:apolipoprotein N-acyltransferase